jgi:hypothetical protein
MYAQRATFNLRGTNINLPCKIRKFRPEKIKSEKQENLETEEALPFIIEAKATLNLRVLTYGKQQTVNCSADKRSESSGNPSPTLPLSSSRNTQAIKNLNVVLSLSNSKLGSSREQPLQLLHKGREHYSSMKSKRCVCGDCEECMKDFAYFLHLFSDNQNLPEITAKSWCVWRRKNGKYSHYYGKRIHKAREIASLTKMVTAITALDFLSKWQLEPSKVHYQVRKTSTLIGGTTAFLEEGQVCTLLDLLYGMMLPSGNDAAIALSEAIGLLSFLRNRGKLFNPEGL